MDRRAARHCLALCLCALLVLAAGCGRSARQSVILAGSTSVQPFAEVLAEDFMKAHPGTNVDVQGGGSSAGILAVTSGTAQIGMSSRNLTADEMKLWSVEIAKDGLALIVNPKNPVGALSLSQVRSVYAGAVTNWKELGGTDRAIHVVAREDGSGTRSAFESMVMAKAPIVGRAIVQDSNGAVRQVISDDAYAIGFVSMGLVNQSVKAIRLDGVDATRENVVSGQYRLSRPFLFVAKEEPTGLVKQFVDFVLSFDGQEILEAEGLIAGAGSSGR